MSIIRCFLAAFAATLLLGCGTALAQGDIRDAEIESTLRLYYTPIFKAAGLDASAVHVYIINDPQLNSFVAGGQNVFINTGTITRSETPNQLVGIVAHETGHIAGGHLIRTEEALRNASIESIIALVAGAAAGAAGHNMGMGTLGAEGVGTRSFLAFSVAQEATADQAALNFLDKTHQSARGLLQFFQILQGTELLTGIRETPYLRTHPLTSQRVDYIRNHVEHSPYSDVPDPPEWVELHKRMKAKLISFLNAPSVTLRQYPPSDTSIAGRYARAIANYRIPDLKKAVDLMDGLIKDEPKNPFFYEMKGQMLFENGHVKDALGPYREAVRLSPDIALLKVELGQVEIETEDPTLLKDAITHLRSAVVYENRNPEAWHFLGVAYGKSGDEGNALLALAEESMANGNAKAARSQADRASHLLPFGSPAQLRAEDIKFEAEHAIKKDNK